MKQRRDEGMEQHTQAGSPDGPPAFGSVTGIVLAGDPDGAYAPLFQCDQCRDYIRHAQRAVVEWDTPDGTGTLAHAFIRHQDCQHHMARWMQLDIFLMQLGWNSGTPATRIGQLEGQGGTRGVW